MPDINKLINILNKRDAAPAQTTPDPDKPISKPTAAQSAVGTAIKMGVRKAVNEDKPYELSEGAVKSGLDPSLTCIGGACNLYKNIGIDFSGLGSEAEGVRESRTGGKVVEFNPTFAKNYAAAGFEKLKDREVSSDELTDFIKNGDIQPGDIVQYINEKGVPEHSNVVYEADKENGTYKVYNAFAHSTTNTRGSQDPFVYNLIPNAATYKNKKFNVYRLSAAKAEEINKKSWEGDKGIYKANLENTLDNEIKSEKEILRRRLKEMPKWELKEKFGVEHDWQIEPDIIDKIAVDNYAWRTRNDTDPNELVRKYRTADGNYKPIGMDLAVRLASQNAEMQQMLKQGSNYGSTLDRIHYNVMKKKKNGKSK